MGHYFSILYIHIGLLLAFCLLDGANTCYGQVAEKITSSDIDQNSLGPLESKNQVIKFTDRGIQPDTLKMKRQDSIVFFLNDSTDSLVTFKVNFKNHNTHCATTNMHIGEDGLITSTTPLEPRNFASICFPDSGEYPFEVFGLKNSSNYLGTIIVE